MEEIAKIFKINKTGIMQTFIILIICSVAGNIIHDVIMLMENIGLVERLYSISNGKLYGNNWNYCHSYICSDNL